MSTLSTYQYLLRIFPKTVCVFYFFISPFFPVFASNWKSQIDIISEKMEFYGSVKTNKVYTFLDSLYSVIPQNQDSTLYRAYCLYWETLVNCNQRKPDSTLMNNILKQKIKLSASPYSFENSLLDYSLSLIHYLRGDYDRAFMIGLQTLEQFKRMGNKKFEAYALASLGVICSTIKSYDLAEEYYNQALRLMDNSRKKDRIRINKYITWHLNGNPDMAIDSLEAFVSLFTQQKDTAMLMLSYTNLGACYSMQGDNAQSFKYYEKMQSLMSMIQSDSFEYSLYQNLGVYYLKTHDLLKAKIYFEKAKNISTNDFEQLSFVYLGLSQVYEETGLSDSAYVYLKLYHGLVTDKIGQKKSLDVYRAYISTTMESMQKELTIAGQGIELRNRRLTILMISAIGVILLITSWLIILQQQKRHIRQQNLLKEVENRELEERLQSKYIIEKLQEERIEAQTREITSQSLLLSNKNEVLQKIGDVVKRITKQPKETSEINQIIKNSLYNNRAWNNFMLHFEQVHPFFFNKLIEQSEELTKTDLRLCAYIRIGIDPKQIAQILNISYGYIRIHRYRLKKKLNLEEEESLDNFIRNI